MMLSRIDGSTGGGRSYLIETPIPAACAAGTDGATMPST